MSEEETEESSMPKEEFDAIMEGFFTGIDDVKPEDLPVFIKQVMDTVADIADKDMSRGYCAAPVAVGACAVAAAWAANSHERAGGITGFQASFVMWTFIQQWMRKKSPMRLFDYEDMLFPQYEERFQRKISKDTWEWLRSEAKKRLSSDGVHPNVRAHWQSIVDGRVPFGYAVENA